ncbi:serine dehydratase beta chain [Kribbella deserti]|uniref:L-serine ammonia-lyase n=1 Tax=Kribbella deserti TaxID=1926257 RepID=A0ABV6QF59_9ACTN
MLGEHTDRSKATRRTSVAISLSIGIGPSSSHTVDPMGAVRTFVTGLTADGLLARTAAVKSQLFGSLGAARASSHGHGSNKAVWLGLEGEEDPETVAITTTVDDRVAAIRSTGRLRLVRTRFRSGKR